jgi:hypothetical protein
VKLLAFYAAEAKERQREHGQRQDDSLPVSEVAHCDI